MSKYTNRKINVSKGQMDKIKKAVQAGTGVSIRLTHADIRGKHVLALTQAQINKMDKAYHDGKGITLKMSKSQVKYNTKVEGGFIGALLPLLATAGNFILSNVLPSLAKGALSGLGSAAATKAFDKITGSGVLYVKKKDIAYKVVPAGQGLYLSPWQKGNTVAASGLYMKSGSGYVNGKGLLLGPNSPFQNIPILGMIL
jgi:hypothetical protein